MNRKFLHLIAVLIFLSPVAIFGQQYGHKCGITFEDAQEITKRLKKNKEYIKTHAHSRSAVEHIPIRYILASEANGSGRVTYKKVLDAHCLLNEKYADQDIQFYIKEFEDLPSSNIFNTPTTTASRTQIIGYLNSGSRRNAINIFITNNADSGGGVGTTLAYYSPAGDYILADMDYILRQNVLPHEVGHFLSLLHPFNGWDNEPWEEVVHGNPAPNIAPGNSFAPPFGAVLTEKMDSSNCQNSGDYLCDTPPDYNFGILLPNCSEYNGPAQDPNGTVVEPMENNIMSYFANCSNYQFTQDQADMVYADLQSPERLYIRPNYTPNAEEVTTKVTLESPASGTDFAYYNDIVFIWDDVDNADSYLIEIADIPNFGSIVHSEIVGWNSALATLPPDDNYWWRVTAFNETHTCTNTTSTPRLFSTGSLVAVQDIQELNAWEIVPNPTTSEEGVNVNIAADEAFQASVSVYSLTGQLVYEQNDQFVPAGNSNISIATGNWQAGMYVVSLRSEKGVATKRVVVTK